MHDVLFLIFNLNPFFCLFVLAGKLLTCRKYAEFGFILTVMINATIWCK